MNLVGEQVTSLFSTAQYCVLIVAPFVRSEALARVLDSVPDHVKVAVVTRWRVVDLLANVSDLGVYDVAKSRSVSLYLRHDLHAKFFAADNRCLVGSANVTNTALGWRMPANFELLAPLDRTDDYVVEFENALFAGAVRATPEQRDRIQVLLDRLGSTELIHRFDHTTIDLLPPNWVPRVRNPSELYALYRGDSDVSHARRRIMQEELAQIGVLRGMDEGGFRAWVAAIISQTPLVAWVVQQVDDGGQVTETELRDRLAELGVDTNVHRPRDVLETLQRWLTFFLPMRYETARDSIKLIRARDL